MAASVVAAATATAAVASVAPAAVAAAATFVLPAPQLDIARSADGAKRREEEE